MTLLLAEELVRPRSESDDMKLRPRGLQEDRLGHRGGGAPRRGANSSTRLAVRLRMPTVLKVVWLAYAEGLPEGPSIFCRTQLNLG